MAKQDKTPLPEQDLEILSETERLKRDIYRPDMEKFRLFCQMLRNNALLKKAVIKHK